MERGRIIILFAAAWISAALLTLVSVRQYSRAAAGTPYADRGRQA